MSHQENAPLSVTPGAIRFNTDSMKLEYYRGGPVGFGTTTQTGEWVNLTTDSPDIQTGGARGMFVGGDGSDVIDYVNIASTGNATDFGNLTKARQESGGFSNTTRGIVAGDSVPASDNTIDFWTIPSTGNAQDFGDLTQATNSQGIGGFANQTRGVFTGGYNIPGGRQDVMQYVTILSQGNTVDFGNLSAATSGPGAGIASPTRGFRHGGTSPTNSNTIEYVTISTLGNMQDFGDLLSVDASKSGASNATRGLSFHSVVNDATIEYITMASTGNAQDFGDLSTSNHYSPSSGSSPTRAVNGGGGFPSTTNVIEYVEISTTGNAVDFGDLSVARSLMMVGCFSNGHGGLG
jgi:hypothetical protein